MENASKALLIAGSILIVILIIGVGMLVYQSTQGLIGEGLSQMSSQEKDLFNQKFEKFAGTRVNGSNVRALISTVKNNNNQLEDEKDPKYVQCTYDNPNEINTARTYTVTITDEDNDGLVDKIDIQLYTSGSKQ